ncbi:MAG: helix-turn-helix domain-containing protein [Chloroflexi bacterium]|nr:helix-turn-helix domain-containing protein [Chloroflexota bacterium]MCL5110236.1 helix-turn-helix domain-containing protein [Chloroflexota bacterium]
MRVGEIKERLLRERGIALDTRDPLAIRRAGDRYKAIAIALADRSDTAEVDPNELTLNLRDAAKALGHSVREVRQLAYDRRLPSRRVGSELRIPLVALL